MSPDKQSQFQKGLVSVIVVNWNGHGVVEACIESLLGQSYSALEVILVDNASQDQSPDQLEAKFGNKIRLHRSPKNEGFAGGVARGIQESRGEFIALLNPDAVAHQDWIGNLVASIQKSESIGMCASKIYLIDRENILDNTGEVISRDGLARARGRLEKDQGQYDHLPETLCPSGCAAFYRRTMLAKIGGFDPLFFLYAEDIDVGLRGRLLGYSCRYVPEAIVHHRLSSSSSAVSSLKAFYVERNRLWIVLKCFPFRHLIVSPWTTAARYFYHVYGLIFHRGPAAQYVKQNSPLQLLWILIRTYFSTFLHLPHLLRKRRELQKIRRLSVVEFETLLKTYGTSSRESALGEIA